MVNGNNKPKSDETSERPNKTCLETVLKTSTGSRRTTKITGVTKNGVPIDPMLSIMAGSGDVIEITGEMSYPNK